MSRQTKLQSLLEQKIPLVLRLSSYFELRYDEIAFRTRLSSLPFRR